MSALNAALCTRGIILWLAVLLASRSTHSAPVYDQDTTQVAEYDGATAGCYFNYQRYQEGDRIITSEPCLNCTCHNRMLMCYLKVCPFTKPIGQDCTVEKRADQCCPVITCPEVPVQLLTSTTSAPATSQSTEIGFHDNYGCNVDDRFYPDGAQLPLDHHNPCELCYCIRNRTTCVMQECTLRVAGCKPVYQPGVCCPIKYNCEYDEELDTTVGPTPGLIMTTTLPPGIMPQCYHEGKVYEDGNLIYSTQPCQHCYCFRGEIACAVQNCGTPMQAHGKNCTALPPPEGECCPTTYQCEEGEQGIIPLPEDEEQLPEQAPHDFEITESPMLIDQEQQTNSEKPEEEAFPGADNIIPEDHKAEEESAQGTIEQVTEEHMPSTVRVEETTVTLPTDEEEVVSESQTITGEKESTSISSSELTTEEAAIAELPSKTEETPTTVEATEEVTSVEPVVRVLEASSSSEGLQPEEGLATTEQSPVQRVSTEKEYSTLGTVENEQPSEPSAGGETQTEGAAETRPEDTTTISQEKLPEQEEVTEMGKVTGEVSATETSEKAETSTDMAEKVTSPIVEAEQAGISTVPQFVTESSDGKLHPIETASGETLATETESPSEKATVAYETSATEQSIIDKEMLHPTEITVTEEAQPSEASSLPEEQVTEQQHVPQVTESEKEQEPPTIEEKPATMGAKKEDAGLTESPVISEEPVIVEEQHTEKSTPEIPSQGPTGVPIPERMPEQKAEDENVYHVTEDYRDVTRPEPVSPDSLITELPQKVPTMHFPHDEETTLAPFEKTMKPITEESTESHLPAEETVKPMSDEVTEIHLTTQSEPSSSETTMGYEETKTEGSPSQSTVAQGSTESFVTTIAYDQAENIPTKEIEQTKKPDVSEEIETETPEDQSTEEITSGEEMPAKGLTIGESGESSSEEISSESNEKDLQSTEQAVEEAEAQTPIATKPEVSSETPAHTSTEQEFSTIPSDLGKEEATEGEKIVTEVPSVEVSTQLPEAEEKQTEVAPIEEEKPITSEQPTKEYATEESVVPSDVTGEEEKEMHTDKPVTHEERTTEIIKTSMEPEERPTTEMNIVEEKTEQPVQEIPKETVTEDHDLVKTEVPTSQGTPEKPEGTESILTETAEQQTETTIVEKQPSTESEPTEVSIREETEMPVIVEHSTEKVEEETEEKTMVPVTETESTEAPIAKEQTESSVSAHVPTQPSITDRKEDQESVEPSEKEEAGEEEITQKPSLIEKEVTDTYEETQKPMIPLETETIHVPMSEEPVSESTLPEEESSQGTTESIGTEEVATQPAKQPEITSEQPEEIVTKSFEQEEHTQETITEGPTEVHVRKETETPIPAVHEESTLSSTLPEESVAEEGTDISKSTEVTSTSEDTTKPASTPVESTKLPEMVEEHTDKEGEVSIEKEIITESVPLEEGQREQTMQPSLMEEKPSEEKAEGIPVEVPTEQAAIPETPEVPVTEAQRPEDKREEEEGEKTTPIYEQQEHSTIAAEEMPGVKITTEVTLKEAPKYPTEYSTSVPEEFSTEEVSTPHIAPRPSGIPGEGNCLVEGQSYSNNSAVPPANVCQTSCRCVSSIVQCELVECPPPPAHLSNCMPVHTSGESCCPMYACDSTPTVELESDNHMMEPHTPETEEDSQKTVPPVEMPTEESTGTITETEKESSTLAAETITPESRPTEVTTPSVSETEKEVESTGIDKQQTTLKPVESVYEESTTAKQLTEQYPEEHTTSSVTETSEGPSSQVPEEQPDIESKISEGGSTEATLSTEQPIEETVEKQTTIHDEEQQVITSTHAPVEEPHEAEKESSTFPHKEEEVTVPSAIEEEETTASVKKEEEATTIKTTEKVEIATSTEQQEKSTEVEGMVERSTIKPSREEAETEKSEEEKIQPPTSEETVTAVEETSTVQEQPVVVEQPVKPTIPGEQETLEPTKYETTSIPEIQSTTGYKPHDEVTYGEEKVQETITPTESEQTVQTEGPEIHTKLPAVFTSESETQEPIAPTVESSTLIHDHTITEETPLEEHATLKPLGTSTEESKEETEPASTEAPAIEGDHTTPTTSSTGLETGGEEIEKSTEEPTSEILHEETSPEAAEQTERTTGIEHAEEYTEIPVTEHELSVTKLFEEKPSESISPEVETEQPTKTTEIEETSKAEVEEEKATESSVIHEEPESTQAPIEEHSEMTPEIHTDESISPVEEHTEAAFVTTAQEEQAITSIAKDSELSLGEKQTEQPISVSEVQTESPKVETEHTTTSIEEQTTVFEKHPVEEQSTLAEGKTPESATIPEVQVTEKPTDVIKPETKMPDLTEQSTDVPNVQEEIEEQKPEEDITKETNKEELPTTEIQKVETTEEATKEETFTYASTTEEHVPIEEHTEQEGIKVQKPVESETTTILKEQEPEEEDKISLPEHPTSERITTVESLAPEEHSTISIETEEQEITGKPEYQTTPSISEEEVSKPVTEISELEKVPEEESSTAESVTEGSEEPITKVSVAVSSSELPEILSKTEKPIESEEETKLPEVQQGETSTKTVLEDKLSEEISPEVSAPEEKSTLGPFVTGQEASEEAHTTLPTVPTDTSPVYVEEEQLITKLQPTEEVFGSEEETSVPSQSTESGEVHSSLPEESQLPVEHTPETSITTGTEEQPEIEPTSSEANVPIEEYPVKISGTPIELPEEKIPVEQVPSEKPEPETPTRPDEVPQSTETPVEEHVTKISDTVEEVPEESEEAARPHIDHFPEPTAKPETDYSVEGELTLGMDEDHLRPVNHTVEMTERPFQPSYHDRLTTTLAPHIPEYPDQSVSGEENPHFPVHGGGYLNPDEDYDEDDQAIYGPGTCRYGGKVYVSAQQIPRDDPCDFCFCFRSDIICLQQSCPPPIPGCHEEPISGFCCPRYECPVSMATALNLTTTTTTTTTTLPPHFHAHAYKGAARRSGCQIRGQAYRVGEVIKSASGPCLHCTCGGDGNMKCDPRVCSPEPMLRQMIATATAKRRR